MKTIIENHKKTVTFVFDFINFVVLLLLFNSFYGSKSGCREYITNIELPISFCLIGYDIYLLICLSIMSFSNIFFKNIKLMLKIKTVVLIVSIFTSFFVSSLTTIGGGS